MFLRSAKRGAPPVFRWVAEEARDGTDPAAGFPAGARVLTADGPRALRSLRPGDRVWSPGDGFLPVLAVERHILRPEPLADPRGWPVRVAPDALGKGVPERALLLSPAQRICLKGRVDAPHAPPSVVLVPILALVNGSSIAQRPPDGPVPAVRFLLGAQSIVPVEGLPCEAPRRRRLFGLDPLAFWPTSAAGGPPRGGSSGTRARP
ncbi:Hint domain-containing protein [Cereibacter sphaeroides]|uniref:Hint domain-containing protein n=1 Tax=Cereibacter sphaeroides TaxID=1063 RepID=UPI001F16035E|nr:Hint domain-containing protein [Cereibacter sphaeroides]MCE6959498.1 Hint domain-containing protein [Cereibacter sphaeroides]MCE6968229.1 Hint domain-containing protein [Cereibacter sphaeroides]MCE6973731.1 Hint domain-containing protein [Cereibacter sphaeroides]